VRLYEAGGIDNGGDGHAIMPPRAQNRQNEHLGCSFCGFCASERTGDVGKVGRVEGGGDDGGDSRRTTVPPHTQNQQNEHTGCSFCWFCASEGTGRRRELVRSDEGGVNDDGGGGGVGRQGMALPYAQDPHNEHLECSL
jgi:hypothetical protein